VLGHIQDYLVVAGDCTTSPLGNSYHNTEVDEEKRGNDKDANDTADNEASTFDDGLLKELHESDCLVGSASIVAMSWRLGLDAVKLRSWAIRHDKLRVVSRLGKPGDDWGGV
jgi:hypothetical protein